MSRVSTTIQDMDIQEEECIQMAKNDGYAEVSSWIEFPFYLLYSLVYKPVNFVLFHSTVHFSYLTKTDEILILVFFHLIFLASSLFLLLFPHIFQFYSECLLFFLFISPLFLFHSSLLPSSISLPSGSTNFTGFPIQ